MLNASLRVAFHTSGGEHLGFGHIRRCLSLAEVLRDNGNDCVFFLEGDARSCQAVQSAGFQTTMVDRLRTPPNSLILRPAPDAVVVDSYEKGPDHPVALGKAGPFTVAVDDLADRYLPVHLIVNGSAGAEDLTYAAAPYTRYLVGPRYALLRSEFAAAPHRTIPMDVQKVLVSVGGADPDGLTTRLIRSLAETCRHVHADVVVGPLFGDTKELRQAGSKTGVETALHFQPPFIRQLMLNADLAISAGGQTTYELAATGTPTIAVSRAPNQVRSLSALAANGTLLYAGSAADEGLNQRLSSLIWQLSADREARARMSGQGRALVDGGGTSRVAQAIVVAARRVMA